MYAYYSLHDFQLFKNMFIEKWNKIYRHRWFDINTLKWIFTLKDEGNCLLTAASVS